MPVLTNCSAYNEISTHGNQYLKACPIGQYYNCFNKKCQDKVWPPCCQDDPRINEIPSSYECLKEEIIIKDSKKCGRFYTCFNSKIWTHDCPIGEDYDTNARDCISDEKCHYSDTAPKDKIETILYNPKLTSSSEQMTDFPKIEDLKSSHISSTEYNNKKFGDTLLDKQQTTTHSRDITKTKLLRNKNLLAKSGTLNTERIQIADNIDGVKELSFRNRTAQNPLDHIISKVMQELIGFGVNPERDRYVAFD